jgi:hypothetical protein
VEGGGVRGRGDDVGGGGVGVRGEDDGVTAGVRLGGKGDRSVIARQASKRMVRTRIIRRMVFIIERI